MKKIFCLAVLIFALAGCGTQVEPPVGVFAGVHTGGAALDSLVVRGVVESVDSRNIYSTLGFLVDYVPVEVGDEVTEGQILAVLDTADLELMIAQARVDLAVLSQMAEIIPPQRLAELETFRQMAALTPRMQQSELGIIRQSNENMLQISRRMFDEAYANLENNSNIHILSAEAALTAAELNLATVRRNYEIARRDIEDGGNPLVTATRLQLEITVSDHERFEALYEAGGLSRNDLRQSENALIAAQNAYNDATEAERRVLEQLEDALYAAVSTHADAVAMLETTRLAAEQELEALRGNLATAEIAVDLEPMEIAVNMSALETASNLDAFEHAVNLEIIELNANLERAEIALALLESQLADSVITAPISGTVTAAIAREGAVGAGLMFIVEDTGNLRILARFREYDIAHLETGMEVAITADATAGETHTGTIRRINPSAVPDSPIVEFEVEIAIPQNTGLRIGMNARIEVAV